MFAKRAPRTRLMCELDPIDDQLQVDESEPAVKAKLIGYWIATTLIGLETLAGGLTDLMHGRASLVSGPYVLDIITHLGYPAYLLVILGVWKVAGGIVLFAPRTPRLKEWAYAGIFFELSGAAASWALHGDPAKEWISPLILAVVAMASWALRPPDRMLGAFVAADVPVRDHEDRGSRHRAA